MIATLLFGIFAVSFAFLAKYRNFKYGLEISFSLIFLFLSLRYNFGNDYRAYLNNFLDINRFSAIDLTFKPTGFEPGWILLCRVFKPLGFFAMTAVLSLVNSFIYYRFIKKYVPLKYYWLAVLLYVFNPSFLLIHASAMRQAVSIMLFVFSLDYLNKKDPLRYLLCVALASLFHLSALILIPIYFFSFLNERINFFYIILLLSAFLSLFYFGQYFLPGISNLVGNYFPKYSIYEGGTFISTGLGILFSSYLYLITLYFSFFQTGERSILFKLAIISYLLIPLSITIMALGRITMYFEVATIAVFPIILNKMTNPFLKYSFVLLLILFTFYNYFQFFDSEIYGSHYRTYQTILSASKLF